MADQELMTIIQNIEALVQQAKQATGGAEASSENSNEDVTPEMLEKIMRAMGEDEGSPEDEKEDKVENLQKSKRVRKAEEEDKEEELKKSKRIRKGADEPDEDDKVDKSDLGVTANDSADERAEDSPSEDEINAVAKAFLKQYRAKKSVQKSSDKDEMYKIMKSLATELSETKKAVGNILEGLGVSEKILAPVQKSLPMNNLDEIQKSLDMIKNMAGEKEHIATNDGTGTGSHYVAKSLAEGDGSLLRGIFHRNAR